MSKETYTCEHCGRQFERYKSTVERRLKGHTKHLYCSRSCAYKSPLRGALISKQQLDKREPPQIEMTDTEAAYLAGIIDGEGSFILSSVKGYANRFNVQLYVANTNKQLIDKIHDDSGIGNVYRAKKNTGSSSVIWHWMIASRVDLIAIINIVGPYLIAKKRQSEIVQTYCSRRTSGEPISEFDRNLAEQLSYENNKHKHQ